MYQFLTKYFWERIRKIFKAAVQPLHICQQEDNNFLNVI